MRRLVLGLVIVVLVGVGQAKGAIYSVTDLGDLSGGEDMSHAMAVNNLGQVVGLSEVAGGAHAFLWQNGVMTDLDVFSQGHNWSVGLDINDSGQVVGTSAVDGTGGGVSSRRPFLYSDAYGINDSTQVVGGVNYVGHADYNHGVLWENGTMTDLGGLPGGRESMRAHDINNLGQVVGESGVSSSPLGHAFLWQNDVMTDLGVLPGTDSSWAYGINDGELVVGTSGHGTPASRAFLWDSTNGIQDLNSMLDSSGADWTLLGSRDISNAGHIVGWGINPDGSEHGFLLTPIPEPSTIVIWSVLGTLGIVYGWRRRRTA